MKKHPKVMGHYFFVLWRKQKTRKMENILLTTTVTSEGSNSEYNIPHPCVKAVLKHSMPALFFSLIKN